jgi:AcrR family transcriptional regulator
MLPGRPRDPRIDAAVMLATRDLLQGVGYARLSIAAVARRAGTTKPAIYRRWPTKAHLVHEAVFPLDQPGLIPDSDDIEADLRAMVGATVELFGRPEVRAALAGLLAELAADPALHPQLLARLSDTVWGRVRARLDRAIASGQVRPGVDAGVLIDVIGGAAFLAVTAAAPDPPGDRWADATVALLLQGVRP